MHQFSHPLAKTSLGWAASGAALVASGPLLSHLRVVSPMTGFSLMSLGLLAALVGAVGGAVAGVLSIQKRSKTRDTHHSGLRAGPWALALGATSLWVVLLSAGSNLLRPSINDITTDLEDPPRFLVASPRSTSSVSKYPEAFAPIQRQAYPELETLALDVDPSTAFARARAAGEKLGWEWLAADQAEGRLQAVDETCVFRFRDDIVVRVRGTPGQRRAQRSSIDVRSKSREGKGDLGKNAARIRAFLGLIRQSP